MKNPKHFLKKALIVTSLLTAALHFVQCSKKAPESAEASQNRKSEYLVLKEVDGKVLRHIKQAYITDLNGMKGGNCVKLGRNFTGKASANSNYTALERGGSADSLSLDSTVWLIEACLNYNFDYYNPIWDTTSIVAMDIDTLRLTVSISDAPLNCAFDDAKNLYDSLSNYISTKYGDSLKVYGINVEGYVFNPAAGIGYITVEIIPVNTSARFHSPCLCYNYWSPSGNFDSYTLASNTCGCTTQNGYDGSVILQSILNCYWNPCRPAQSTWSNIVGGLVIYWTSTNNFLNTGFQNCTNWCSNPSVYSIDCGIIAQQKTYFELEANANIPTAPLD